ncbi:MAG: LEA type 2 family protein [Bacteroidia bacterium]
MAKNTSKHLLWIIPLALLLIAGGYIFYRYKTFRKPYLVNMDTDVIVRGKKPIARLKSTAYIYNPNNIEVHTDSMRFKIYIDGKLYSTGRRIEGFTLKANDTSVLEIPYTFDMGKFFEEFEKTQKDSGLHRIEGELFVDIWKFNSVRIPFSYEKNSPVFKASKAEILKVKLQKLGLKETILETTIRLDNPNDIAISSEHVSYSFLIEDEIIAEGAIPRDKFLPKEDALEFTFPIILNMKEALNEIGIFRKKYIGKSYTLNINTTLKTKNPTMPTVTLDMAKTGSVEELLEDMKEKREEKKEEKKEERKEERKQKREERKKEHS